MMGSISVTDVLADVAAAPGDPRIGAFFDLDGTMLDGFTPAAHARYRIRRREATLGEMLGVLEAAVRYRTGRMKFDHLLTRAAGYLRGCRLDELQELGERLFADDIRPRLHVVMTEVVRAHLQQGHTVVLSSSAMDIHAAPVARGLGIEHLICNHFELDGMGHLTGEIVKPIIWGARKADAVAAFSADHGVDLERSYFYADGDEDVALMRAVGNPRPVNPRPRMAATAAAQGWPVLRVSARRRGLRRIGLNTSRG
jgi:HAD superfamily hydrolase (TIGR01490 family)